MSVIYSSRMESLDWFDDVPANGTVQLVPKWGIDRGNAITCSNNETTKIVQPDLNTVLTQGTIRWQYAYVLEGEDGERELAIYRCANTLGGGGNNEFSAWLLLEADGSLRFRIAQADRNSYDGTTSFSSAPGVVFRDGRYNAFQFRFSFPNHSTINFEFLVNNVSVLVGTCTTTVSLPCAPIDHGQEPIVRPLWTKVTPITLYLTSSHCEDIQDVCGINVVIIFHHRDGYGTVMSSLVELIIDDSNAPVSYLPGNAPKLLHNACEFPPQITCTVNSNTAVVSIED